MLQFAARCFFNNRFAINLKEYKIQPCQFLWTYKALNCTHALFNWSKAAIEKVSNALYTSWSFEMARKKEQLYQ
jgi:hypothetical protein